MAIFKKPAIKSQNRKKRDIPHGLFQKCPGCSEVVPEIELAQNQRVCPRCDYHFTQSAKERIGNLLDPESFVEMDADLKSVDTLRFQGMATYKDRLKKYQGSTGLLDAVISGYGILDGYKVAIAVMDFGFLAATMGSVVGERVTRTIEYGTAEGCAVIMNPGQPRLNLDCAIVRNHICSAYYGLVQVFLEAKQYELAKQTKQNAIQNYHCTPDIFQQLLPDAATTASVKP